LGAMYNNIGAAVKEFVSAIDSERWSVTINSTEDIKDRLQQAWGSMLLYEQHAVIPVVRARIQKVIFAIEFEKRLTTYSIFSSS
jgi:hypothetical protein